MYMTSDQYSWAMMKHGHKMLISSACVSVFVYTMCGWLCCSVFIVWVRFSFSFRLHWLISIFLSIFCWLLHFKHLLNLNLSFFLSLCITHISLNALNIFRWTIAFQSVMFGCFFFISSQVLFCFHFHNSWAMSASDQATALLFSFVSFSFISKIKLKKKQISNEHRLFKNSKTKKNYTAKFIWAIHTHLSKFERKSYVFDEQKANNRTIFRYRFRIRNHKCFSISLLFRRRRRWRQARHTSRQENLTIQQRAQAQKHRHRPQQAYTQFRFRLHIQTQNTALMLIIHVIKRRSTPQMERKSPMNEKSIEKIESNR